MAALLHVSTRAVQSYEQGWRPAPQHVQALASLLLYLNRQRLIKNVTPCWTVRNCSAAAKAQCPAHQFRAGSLCWLLTGTRCMGKKQKNWQAKMAKCSKCDVVAGWLNA
jgi:hypothetical protein